MMTASIIIRQDDTQTAHPGGIPFGFRYNHDMYREITNTKAYTSEALLGQVGGFVGKSFQFIMKLNIPKYY